MSRIHISLLALVGLLLIGAILPSVVSAENETPVVVASQAEFQQEEPQTETSTGSSFFDGLGSIFAVLGVYIVTMFTMAIGTEILVDIVKGILGKPLGLKSKPNTRKALEDYKMFLPGQLEDLGISAEAKLKLEKQLSDLENLLQPAFTIETVANQLQEKEFSAALMTLGMETIGTDMLDQAKLTTKDQLQQFIDSLDAKSTLGKAVQVALKKDKLLEKADKAIDRLFRKAETVTPEQIYGVVSELVSGEVADGVTVWTRAYLNSLQEESYESASSIYENQLKPQIQNFGLPPNVQQQVEGQFEKFLENLQTYRGTDVYLESLNNLLVELEIQRNIVRSWLGQAWEWVTNGIRRLLLRSRVQHPRLAPLEYDPRIEASTKAAAKLLDMEQYDKNLEKRRVLRLRFIPVVFGILLAYMLQVDSAELLKDLFPDNANFLYLTLISRNSGFFMWIENSLGIPTFDLSAGVILTGLAASAGSTFWHGQLARLQAVKGSVETAQQALQPIIIQTQNRND